MKEFNNFYLPPQYFNIVCRVCLSKQDILIPIEEINLTHNLNPNGSRENVTLKAVFQKFCGVEVTASDQKPQEICEFCLNMVCKAFNFFQLFLHSNALLDKKIEEHKSSQQILQANDDDGNNSCLLPIADSSDNVTSENKSAENNSASHVGCEDGRNNTVAPVEHRKPSVSAVTVENVENTNSKRKLPKKKSGQSFPPQLTSVLLEHSHGVLDPVKESALKILLKLKNKFPSPVTEKEKRPPPRQIRQTENQNELFSCRFCKKEYKCIMTIIDHMKLEHRETKRCILCPKKFRTHNHVIYHVATHSPNSLVCKICRLSFETKQALDEHMTNLDHSNPKKCPKCQKIFKSAYQVGEHIDSFHLRKVKYQCELCGKLFRYRGNVERHERNTHGANRFLCQMCGKSFTTNYQLKGHMQKVHNINQGIVFKKYKYKNKTDTSTSRQYFGPRHKQYDCKLCPKKFYSLHLFFMHCEYHPEFKEYVCYVCKKILETRKELLDHCKTHEKFQCHHPQCDKMFASRDLALRHKYSHKKPNRCGTCGAAFLSKHSLQDHLNIHTGKKPYMCEQCGMGFKQSTHLRVHMVQHGVKKPWKCTLCDRAFSYNGLLKCHMRSHTGEKPFPCPFCKKMFRDTTGRQKHVKHDHPLKMKEFLLYKEHHQEDEKRRAELGSQQAEKKQHEAENNSDDSK